MVHLFFAEALNPGVALSRTCPQGKINLTGSLFRVKGGLHCLDVYPNVA
jgi:hypothetical protein